MLAVIVLNWNGGEDLLACLRSVYAQEGCGMPVVAYVPDNASTDGSLEAVGREFPAARVIQNGGNLGFSGGNNPGWRRAVAEGAEWVLFLNNDAALAPGCLRRMLEVCRAEPAIGAACPRIFFGTPESRPGGRPRPDAPQEVWFEKGYVELDQYCGVTHVPATPAELASPWYETPLCTGCCFLAPARVLEATGGFDEGFFAYFEDVDLSLKIRAMGLTCAVVPGALAWHKVGQSTSKEVSPGHMFYCARNLYYLAERHARRPDVWAAFRKIYFRQVVLLAIFYVNQTGKSATGAAVLQGYQYALRGHKGIRPTRRPGPALKGLARAAQGLYAVRNRLRSRPPEAVTSLPAAPPPG